MVLLILISADTLQQGFQAHIDSDAFLNVSPEGSRKIIIKAQSATMSIIQK